MLRPLLRLALITALISSRDTPIAPNLVLIGAPAVWARGFTGQGVVVAVLDTGADLNHPELAARWRGGANSWFDPYNQHPEEPIDLSGHGTQVLGLILGGDASGTQLGVAPGARWIAARIFNDRGRATTAAIHAAFRWALDPDGDPATPDAPQVLNASWSSASVVCDSEFAPDLRALREAGILPVFAAGTSLPASPATLAEALAVGALADANTLTEDGPRGPSPCGPSAPLFPHLVAPGFHLPTTDRNGLYTTADGTSLAAAHVSGALALLLSARPGLSANEQTALLYQSAVDLGAPGPDNEFGYGRLDVAGAVERALDVPGASAPLIALALVLAFSLIWLMARKSKDRPA